VAANTPNRTIHVTLSSDPKCFPHDSDRVQSSNLLRFGPCVRVKFRADTPDEFRFAALGSKHAGETE